MILPDEFILRSPETADDFKKYYQLRYEVLRKPWGQPPGSENDPSDESALHTFMLHKDLVIAVCRLHFNSSDQAQIRYMGVDENYRGYGIGAAIINHIENIAKEMNAKQIILHARENAIPFYIKQGYQLKEKTYLLFGKIQHFAMEKKMA